MADAAVAAPQPDLRFTSPARWTELRRGRSRAEPSARAEPASRHPAGWTAPRSSTCWGDARVGLVVFQPVENYIDAQPTKLFEYLASGVPVVASDFPVWREIVAAVDAGLLVDPTDPAAVSAAIDALLDDPERAAAMGRRGRAAVLERYRWEPQGARLVDLYSRLLAGVAEDVEVPVETVAAAGGA